MTAVHSGRTAAHAVHEGQGQPICEELFVPYIEHEQEKNRSYGTDVRISGQVFSDSNTA